MEITLTQLIGCGIAPTQARLFLDPLNQILPTHGINTKVRVAAFIAQCAHESSNFAVLEESLYYRTPERIVAMFGKRVGGLAEAAKLVRNPKALANRVYANRSGNSNEASGDGWRYRGRGLIQVTLKDNYVAVGYGDNPDLVSQPLHAVKASAKYWLNNNLNAIADASNIDLCTRVINPAMAGCGERRENFREALAAFA